MNRATRLSAAAAVTCLALSAAAQDLGRKAPPQRRGIVIENVTLHPVSDPVIENASIWFEGGVIRALGEASQVRPSGDPERVDGAGKHVYPGLISAVTTLGLVEITTVRATRDDDEVGDITPEVYAAVAINPDSTAIPVTRTNGVLTAGVFPIGGLIPGRASVIRLDGWTWADMTIEADAGVVVGWPSSRPARRSQRATPAVPTPDAGTRRQTIQTAFADARAYHRARAEDRMVPTDLRWEAMRAAVDKQRPVFVQAQDIEQIETAVGFARRAGIRLVLVGGRDADLCTDMLVRNEVAVIVTGTHHLPRRRDSAYDQPFRLPVELDRAGVKWCLASSGQFYNERNLPYEAAIAVAFGLRPEAALRAITLSAAEILGVGDRLGSLQVGKAATLIVTNGDPLEIPTHVEAAFIDGRRIDLDNKQTELAEKYREKYRQLGIWPGAPDPTGK